MRLLLPYMHNYRTELQNHINATYNTNIHIGALTMDWQKVGPVLVANNVRLVNTDATVVFIEHLDIKVNFWRSLQHRTLITRGLTLDGAKVVVDTTKLANNAVSDQDSSVYERLSDVFLLHVNKFSLTNSQIVVRTESGDKKLALKHLNWLNQGDRHRASGEVLAQGLATNTASLYYLTLRAVKLVKCQGKCIYKASELILRHGLGARSRLITTKPILS